MKKTIKLAIVVLVAMLCLGYTTAVNATAAEDLMTYLSKSFTVAGESVTIPSGYLKEVERYIDTYGVTADEVKAIEAKVDEGVAIMNKAGVSDPSKLTDSQKKELQSVAQEAAAVVDATVTFTAGAVTVVGEDGKTFGTFSTTTKTGNGTQSSYARTGSDATLYIVSGVAIIAIAGAVVYGKKKANA